MTKLHTTTKFLLLSVLALAVILIFVVRSTASIQVEAPTVIVAVPSVMIGTATIAVELATTTVAVQKGLSGRPSLAADSGMLFIFSKSDTYRFWMPDMHFPLDMIWINNGKVVDISANATSAFNAANPTFYTPKSPAKDVLEVNAGYSAAHGIEPGDLVTFENIE